MYASNLTTWKPVTVKCKPPAHNLSITAKEKEKTDVPSQVHLQWLHH
jgi:hypothetical protein